MENYNLSAQLSDESWIQDLLDKNTFDLIVSDFDYPHHPKFFHLDSYLPKALLELPKGKKILFILDKLNLQDVFPHIQELLAHSLIINSATGTSSLWYKISPELEDFQLLIDYPYPIYTPVDLHSFWELLEKGSPWYIRLSTHELPYNIYTIKAAEEEEELAIIDQKLFDNSKYYINLHENQLSDVILLWEGSLFKECVSLHALLEQHQLDTNIIISNDLLYTMEHHPLLQRKKKKIILIFDHDAIGIQDFFSKRGKFPQEQLISLSPAYEKITSFYPEYQLEQARFDARQLFIRLEKMLKSKK